MLQEARLLVAPSAARNRRAAQKLAASRSVVPRIASPRSAVRKFAARRERCTSRATAAAALRVTDRAAVGSMATRPVNCGTKLCVGERASTRERRALLRRSRADAGGADAAAPSSAGHQRLAGRPGRRRSQSTRGSSDVPFNSRHVSPRVGPAPVLHDTKTGSPAGRTEAVLLPVPFAAVGLRRQGQRLQCKDQCPAVNGVLKNPTAHRNGSSRLGPAATYQMGAQALNSARFPHHRFDGESS